MENSPKIILPRGAHTQTIILLHGRDSLASTFASELLESQASDGRTLQEAFPTTRWVFPRSGLRESARFKVTMSQWFDMWSVENPDERPELQCPDLGESAVVIMRLIRKEAKLISPEKIILGGISQGCATAIYALLFGGMRLGGFIGLSSWLPCESHIAATMIENEVQGVAQYSTFYNHEIIKALTGSTGPASILSKFRAVRVLKTPVFLAHSVDDEMVPITNGQKLCSALEKLEMKVTWKQYEVGGHRVHKPQGVDDIISFINSCCQVKSDRRSQ
ncbi:hypothetical protein VTL71DRAFT_6602 [Oculimacula yallundae]|uniref:Phospholipase/carboxylesterase/thioesterase domain-containing protein n=1 Tax=Oculimacula yallundae TaxID=86028 RepID=A0ABR4BXF4_9HELO